MEEIYQLTQNKRIFVRKRIGAFLEKALRYCGYDFDHDVFKKVIYSEDTYKTPVEEKIKCYYDAYMYLLSNDKTVISRSLWKRFYYLFMEEELEPFMATKLACKYFRIRHLAPIEQAIEYHLFVYQEFKQLKDEERFMLSLLIFNFILVRNRIPCIQIFRCDFKKYEPAREEYFKGNKSRMLDLILTILKKNPYMEKSYYKNLKQFSLEDILQFVNRKKVEFQTEYHMKGLWVHGSFAKRKERIDSDIDLLVELSLDLNYQQRQEILNEIKKVFFDEFQRMIDIHELIEYLDDEILKEMKTTQKLI